MAGGGGTNFSSLTNASHVGDADNNNHADANQNESNWETESPTVKRISNNGNATV